MFPNNPMNYPPRMNIANIKSPSNFFKAYPFARELTNFIDGTLCKFRHRVFFACHNLASCTTFVSHVMNIVRVCAKKQMAGIYTFTVITMMAYKNIFGYFSEVNLVRCTMSADESTVHSKLTVSRIVDVSCPLPAFGWIANLGMLPKTLLKSIVAPPVSMNERDGLAFHPPLLSACSRGDFRWLPTTALTKMDVIHSGYLTVLVLRLQSLKFQQTEPTRTTIQSFLQSTLKVHAVLSFQR